MVKTVKDSILPASRVKMVTFFSGLELRNEHVWSFHFAGKDSFFWFGPNPEIIVTSPDLVKEILANNDLFPKARTSNPLPKLLANGLVSYNHEKWAKHRKILNPAFYLDKIKVY